MRVLDTEQNISDCSVSCIYYYFFYYIFSPEFTSTIACSHMRVLDFFTESINSACHFRAQPCHSKKDYDAGHCTRCGLGCADMGYNGQMKGHGKYYFSTTSSAPFCK